MKEGLSGANHTLSGKGNPLLLQARRTASQSHRQCNLGIAPETSVQALKDLLVESYPSLRETMDTVVISINREFAFDDALVPDGAEVALFPPVSGG